MDVRIESQGNQHRLYLGMAGLQLRIEEHEGSLIAYVHDLTGDPQDKTAVVRLIKAAEKIGDEAGVDRAIINLDFDRRDLFELYAKMGFKMTKIWMERELHEAA